jgi:hypothetical protein
MIGESVATQKILVTAAPVPKPIGMGSYAMDSHHVQRIVGEDGFVMNEGDIQQELTKPYSIDYGVIVPQRSDCTNLLVPVCLSASHIAYGSIRMEPVFMILGQSAAAAAVIAVNDNVDVQDVSYTKLKDILLAAGQVLTLE